MLSLHRASSSSKKWLDHFDWSFELFIEVHKVSLIEVIWMLEFKLVNLFQFLHIGLQNIMVENTIEETVFHDVIWVGLLI